MTLDMQEQIARIERMQEETRKFSAEMNQPFRNSKLVPGQASLAFTAAGAGLFGAGAAFGKLLLG